MAQSENALRDSRVLVTGGSGFIGANVMAHFATLGCEVLNLDIRSPRDLSHTNAARLCDILDRVQLRSEVQRFNPDFIVHLAARTDLHGRKITDYAANIDGVQNVLDAAATCVNVQRMIVASSRLVCRIGYVPRADTDYCPPNFYGESKVRTEEIVRSSRVPFQWIITRPTSIWGEWFDVPYRTFFESIRRGRYRHPAQYDPAKSFGYVGNFVFQLEKLLLTNDPRMLGATIYQCDYPPLRLRAWADLIRLELGLGPIDEVPIVVLQTIACVGDILEALGVRKFPLTSFRLANLTTEMIYPTTLLQEIVGHLPFTLKEGVRRTVQWMLQR